MSKLFLPPNEEKRLAALYEYKLLNTATEEIIDSITWLAARICNSPISLINLINRETVFIKSAVGIKFSKDIPRETTICSHTILQSDLMEITNLEEDERFKKNPFVTGKEHMRFYAGIPLSTSEGYNLGTLCVVDRQPKKLTEDQKEIIKKLAKVVMALFEAKKLIVKDIKKHEETEEALKNTSEKLQSGLQALQQRNEESLLLAEMSRILQSCLNLEESFLPLTTFCSQFFPETSGAIYLSQESHNFLESVIVWGKSIPLRHFFISEECWALRLSRSHKTDELKRNLICNHIENAKKIASSILYTAHGTGRNVRAVLYGNLNP